MTAVVATDADSTHVFLNSRPHHIPCAAVVAQVDHLDPSMNQLEVHGVDCGVMTVANGNSRENPEG